MKTPFYHFSVDDVFACLADHDFDGHGDGPFCFWEQLYRRYGTLTDLYLFWEAQGKNLEAVLSSRPESRVLEGMPWLRFGPHALNYQTPPYRQSMAEFHQTVDAIYSQVDQIAGVDHRSPWVRLHYFSETFESARFLRSHGIEALLTTDKPAVAYRLPDPIRNKLASEGRVTYNGIEFIRSHFRVENLVRDGIDASKARHLMQRQIERNGFVVLFTHEIDLRYEPVRKMTWACVDALNEMGVRSI